MPVIINGSTGISGTDGSAATPAVQGTDTNTGMFFPAADQIAFAEGGVEAMRLDAAGNVGIGTSSPGTKLDVVGGIWARPGGSVGAVADITADAASGTNGISISASFASGGFGPIRLLTSATERMRIDSAGNVGIGVSALAGKLDILTGTNRCYFDDAGGAFVRLNGVVANNSAYGPLAINGSVVAVQTFGLERMRIDASGNVGIGTSSPATAFEIFRAGATDAYARMSNGNGGSLTVGAVADGSAIVFNGANTALRFFTNSTERARITSGGDFQFNSGYGSAATAFGCRAWVNFNGTGTVAIRASGNVSSITDNGAGDYTVNLTTAMPDVNYAIAHGRSDAFTGRTATTHIVDGQTTSTLRVISRVSFTSYDVAEDALNVYICVFR